MAKRVVAYYICLSIRNVITNIRIYRKFASPSLRTLHDPRYKLCPIILYYLVCAFPFDLSSNADEVTQKAWMFLTHGLVRRPASVHFGNRLCNAIV
jgi:hypothetical protein